MRGLKLLILGLLFTCIAMAQSGFVQNMGYNDYFFRSQVNIGGITPRPTHPSAYLDLGLPSGSTKGFLLPRGFRSAISNPAEGLVFYDKGDKATFYFNGISWEPLGRDTSISRNVTSKVDSVRIRNDSAFYYSNGGTEYFAGYVGTDLSNYYTKANLQTSGQASVHWDNITNAPPFLTNSTLYTLTYGTTTQWDYAAKGPNVQLTLLGNSTLGFINLPTGVAYLTLEVIQDATGGRTLSIPASVQILGGNAAYSLSTTGGAVDILTFYWNGSTLYMNHGKDYKY